MTWIYAAVVLAVVVFIAAGFKSDKSEYRDASGTFHKNNNLTWKMNKKM